MDARLPDTMPRDAADRTREAYDAAADCYDDPALGFWDRFGRATIDRMALAPGMTVLDAACGSGASALPAAERVGPEGAVVGVDLSLCLLDLARAKAASRGLKNANFMRDDFLAQRRPVPVDAVVCVFGIFFVPDMVAAARSLWRHVKPGGQLAVTTWGPRMFEPLNTIFWEAVGKERPDLVRNFHPWDRISEASALEALLTEAGVTGISVVAESASHPLRSPDDAWTIVMGTGYRGTVEQLDSAARERVRVRTLEAVRARAVTAIETNVIYALANRPAGAG